MGKVALIAGKGPIVKLAIEALGNPLVISVSDQPEYPFHYRFSPGEVGRILKTLKKEGITKVAFFGKVEKKGLFKGYKLDLTAVRLLTKIRSFKDDEIMAKVIEVLEGEGIEVIDQKSMLSRYIPGPGLITGKLTEDIKEDIAFGFRVAKAMGTFQIGQTVVVKKRTVIAIEAMEGTDETIERAGRFAEKTVVVKVKRPTQKTLMDLPVIGERTIHVAAKAKVSAIAFEAKETVLDPRATEIARKCGITIVGVDENLLKGWEK